MSLFQTAIAAVEGRFTHWQAQSAWIQNEPTPQLAGAELPILTAVCLTYTINAPL